MRTEDLTADPVDPSRRRIHHRHQPARPHPPHRRASAHAQEAAARDDHHGLSGLAFVPLALTPTYCATKAAIHSWTQSLRYQLRNTNIEVLELVPPYVQTELHGPQQASDPRAMPLADYISETVALLDNPPASGEILVERVLPLRWAEKKATSIRSSPGSTAQLPCRAQPACS